MKYLINCLIICFLIMITVCVYYELKLGLQIRSIVDFFRLFLNLYALFTIKLILFSTWITVTVIKKVIFCIIL